MLPMYYCFPSLAPLCPQDADYVAAGATVGTTPEAFRQDIVLKIRPPGEGGRGRTAAGALEAAGGARAPGRPGLTS